MRERVKVIKGNAPLLLIAPHAPEDQGTGAIAQIVANELNAFAVINQGFEQSDEVDVNNDRADCNRVRHCEAPVVYEEFLKPILKIRQRVTQSNLYHVIDPLDIDDDSFKRLLVLHIHGCGDGIHMDAQEVVGVIVGYGRGSSKDSLTCRAWRKNMFVDLWRNYSMDGEAFEGSGDGRFAARSADDINQYFRKHVLDRQVESMQLTFPHSMRSSDRQIRVTARTVKDICREILSVAHFNKEPRVRLI
jgi:hypothetical protein